MGDPSLEATLQESLEVDFCPPLDSTLVALLVADHISGSKPTEETLRTLRDQLTQLAVGAAADQDDLAKDLHDLRLPSAAPSATEDSQDQDLDSVFSQTGLEGCSSSTSSSTPSQEMSSASHSVSALAFLQALFPCLSLNQLKARIEASKFDMEITVEELLTDEYVKELEERGLEDEARDEEKDKWTVVSRTPSRASTIPKKRKSKGKTMVLNDVRQKHLVHPDSQRPYSAGDPWSQVASLSSYLETLLSRPFSFFQSYFHKPEHPTPAAALRASLQAIEIQAKEKYVLNVKEYQTTTLATFMEFVKASLEFDFDALDTEAQERICADAELVLSATSGGAADASLDVLKLLHELEVDGASGQEMGVYHSPISVLPASRSSASQGTLSNKQSNPGYSHPASPISSSANTIGGVRSKATLTVSKKLSLPSAPTQNAWQIVPTRRKPREVHPLAAHIPAYDPHKVPRRKTRPVHPSVSKPSSTSTSTGTGNGRGKLVLGGYRARIAECHARRDEVLRTASRHWNAGARRNRGGEVALFYAQEAQRHRDEAQRLQLDALRELVDEKRFSNSIDTDTIDVHHCTIAEALTIIREVLSEGWCTPSRPLRVITGRGTHSSNGVAVLGPAVTKALEQDGWVIGRWDGAGGISVRGRKK